MDIIYKLIDLFPPLVYSSKYDKLFNALNLPVSSSRYLTGILFLSILLVIIFILIDITYLFIALIITSILLLYPFLKYRMVTNNIKADLPKFIINIGSGLLIGLTLAESIRLAMKDSKILKQYFAQYLEKIEQGESINNVLLSFSNRFLDQEIRLTIFQLINSLLTGSARELKQLGMQLLKDQMFQFKEFGNRLQTISQFYVVFMLLLPVYGFTILVMSIASEQPIPDIIPLFVFLFPMILLVFILTVYLIIPTNYLIDGHLDLNPLIFNWLVLIIAYYSNIEMFYILIFYIITSIILLFLNLDQIKLKVYIDRLEKSILDVALVISSLPSFNLKILFERIVKYNIIGWNLLAQRALNMYENGVSVREIFKMFYSIPSKYIRLFITNLEYIYYSGISSHERVVEWLESFINMINLKREVELQLDVFKYTILISLLILPIIYAYIYKFTNKLIGIELYVLGYLPLIIVGGGISMLSTIYRYKFSMLYTLLLSILVVITYSLMLNLY